MDGQNKRAFPRFRTKSTVYASYPGGVAQIRDLSLGGVMLKEPDPIDIGRAVRLCLHLEGKLTFCEGVVRRADLRGMGLQFTRMGNEDRRALSAFLLDLSLAEGRERLNAGLLGAAKPAPRPVQHSGLAALLAQRGVISAAELEVVERYQRMNGASARMLVRSGVISEDALVERLQREYGLPVLDLAAIQPTPEALELVPRELALLHEALPIGVAASALTVAIADPSNVSGLTQIRARAGCELRLMLAPALALRRMIDRFYLDRARVAS